MKRWLQLFALLILTQSVYSCTYLSFAGLNNEGLPIKEVHGTIDIPNQNTIDHSSWDALLKKYVKSDGLVDYKGFLKDRKTLTEYLKMLSQNPPSDSWSTAELLAYYINTYNAYTVDLILKNYPVKSIKDISGAWTKAIVPIGDKNLSLGGIEHSILRKMNEPRIHFAINCASYSCPNLLNEAYTATKIEDQLERVTKAFIQSDKNQISTNKLALSYIFKWYKSDFKVNGKKDLIGFINLYTAENLNKNTSISYLEYNWNLNESN